MLLCDAEVFGRSASWNVCVGPTLCGQGAARWLHYRMMVYGWENSEDR